MVGAVSILAFSACSNDAPPATSYPQPSELYDSKACARCHPTHYDEWSASMHAYAAEDPVFLAMSERGQVETNYELGTFCVNCHAPLAVRLGLTTDGTNLSSLPAEVRGVTCYFCHNVANVEGTHNNPLALSDDVTMRNQPLPGPPNCLSTKSCSAYVRLACSRTDVISSHGLSLNG